LLFSGFVLSLKNFCAVCLYLGLRLFAVCVARSKITYQFQSLRMARLRRSIADDELAKGELSPTTNWPTKGEKIFLFIYKHLWAITFFLKWPRPHIVPQSQWCCSPTLIEMRSTFRSRNNICTNASSMPTLLAAEQKPMVSLK